MVRRGWQEIVHKTNKNGREGWKKKKCQTRTGGLIEKEIDEPMGPPEIRT